MITGQFPVEYISKGKCYGSQILTWYCHKSLHYIQTTVDGKLSRMIACVSATMPVRDLTPGAHVWVHEVTSCMQCISLIISDCLSCSCHYWL